MATTLDPTTVLPAGTWVVDADHSTVEFRVKHVGLARVRGVFHRFEGILDVREDGTADARGTVDAGSLDTRVAARDAHLRSADFFDVEHHPTITFAATAIEPAGDDRLRITGELTIRGVTRSAELDAELLGTGRDDEGAERVGLEITGRLDRRDFGLTWNAAVETGGGILVGNRVDLELEVSAVRRS
jgi:polyisoprenoid-binding protein YceI